MSTLKCPSCGKTWAKHAGIQATCQQKQNLRKRIVRLTADLRLAKTDLANLTKLVQEKFKK